jgi:hypothetical protein
MSKRQSKSVRKSAKPAAAHYSMHQPNHSNREPRKDEYAYRDKLPFMRSTTFRAPNWWNVTPSGDYEIDCQTGQTYAAAFWRVSGGRPLCGIELGQILLAMHDPGRRKSEPLRHNGLSGIEVGFIRTIGEIMDIVIALPALIRERKRLPRSAAKITVRDTRAAARVVQIFLERKHKPYQKRSAEIRQGDQRVR